MAADGRLQAPSVAEQLFDPRSCREFDFFQAVALLERLSRARGRDTDGLAERGEPAREAVRFAGTIRLSFPPSEIAQIAPPHGADQPVMTVNFMSLAGALGPLPGPFAEQVMRRTTVGDTASRDFLDIFNHRLISILYRIRKRHRLGLGVEGPLDDASARYLSALIGLFSPALGNLQCALPDRALLYYSGSLAREVRPIAGLVGILRCHFGVPVDATPLVGGFYPIEASHRTSIGPSGRNRQLSDSAVLGSRYWDPSAAIEIRIGPLTERDYLRFLPATCGIAEGDRLAPLVALVRFYAGSVIDVRLRLVLDPKSACRQKRQNPRSPLRTQTLGERPRLGYTAWVGRAFEKREVILTTTALQNASPRM